MHKLDRNAVPAPPCLADYRHGLHSWEKDLTREHRAQIHAHLEQLQGHWCAYCEGDMNSLGRHVDHLERRTKHPELTFAWSNLYWSCYQDDSCGRYKDHRGRAHDPKELVDPAVHDPDHFFRFRSDGFIEVRSGLSQADKLRAENTLKAFNLQNARLQFERRRALEMYQAQEPDILEFLETLSPAERGNVIADELKHTTEGPFSTVIRHFLERAL